MDQKPEERNEKNSPDTAKQRKKGKCQAFDVSQTTLRLYLNLQKVVELLTCGRKGFRRAELKVPQLVLCSGKQTKHRELQRGREGRKRGSYLHLKTLVCPSGDPHRNGSIPS